MVPVDASGFWMSGPRVMLSARTDGGATAMASKTPAVRRRIVPAPPCFGLDTRGPYNSRAAR